MTSPSDRNTWTNRALDTSPPDQALSDALDAANGREPGQSATAAWDPYATTPETGDDEPRPNGAPEPRYTHPDTPHPVPADGCRYGDNSPANPRIYGAAATFAQPIDDDDIRRPREVQLLVAQLAQIAGLELRQLRTGAQPTNDQLRRAVGIAGSFHVALAELDPAKSA